MTAPELPPAIGARRVLRATDRAALATRRRASADAGAGNPYAALVLLAVDHDASPILLISQLAEHTQDIAADPHVALLIDGTAGRDDPLTGARVTLMGRAEKTADPRHRARYVARHPSAAMYAGFRDFAFYRVAVERAHLVAGFGRIHWINGAEILDDARDAADLAAAEADIVEHMNGNHADAVGLYAARLLRLPAGGWTMTGIDPEGCDLRSGGRVARVEFQRRATTAEAARAELVRLAKQARAAE